MDKELEELLKKDVSRLKDETPEEWKERIMAKIVACNRWLPRLDPRIKGFGGWQGLKNISDDTARLINAQCAYGRAIAFHDPPEYKEPSAETPDEKWS